MQISPSLLLIATIALLLLAGASQASSSPDAQELSSTVESPVDEMLLSGRDLRRRRRKKKNVPTVQPTEADPCQLKASVCGRKRCTWFVYDICVQNDVPLAEVFCGFDQGSAGQQMSQCTQASMCQWNGASCEVAPTSSPTPPTSSPTPIPAECLVVGQSCGRRACSRFEYTKCDANGVAAEVFCDFDQGTESQRKAQCEGHSGTCRWNGNACLRKAPVTGSPTKAPTLRGTADPICRALGFEYDCSDKHPAAPFCKYKQGTEFEQLAQCNTNNECEWFNNECRMKRDASCYNDCITADNGRCDDGKAGAVGVHCFPGSDCYDCGRRPELNRHLG